ncbi:MAG: phage replisome organizer [Verrucomicrobiae bacterium]|nr:phage replisome organizer [Verrucomicrobiae bacterium]
MSTSQKYYYIKLKDNYFDQDNIKVLESMKNGHTYSLIIIKLYLKSAKTDGKLMMTPTIPYHPNKVDILASVIGHDPAHVREAIKAGLELELITIVDGREIWMTDIQNFIGQSSTEADRKRSYRLQLEERGQMSGQMSAKCPDKSPPEIRDRDRDKSLDKESGNSAESPAVEQPPSETKQLAQDLADLLLTLHTKEDPKYNPNTSRWAGDIEKLIRLDERDAEEVERVIRWCKTPGNFWFPNIMSGKKLREKFSMLLLQMQRDGPYGKKKAVGDINAREASWEGVREL